MKFVNAKIFTPEGFISGGFQTEGEYFGEIFSGDACDGTDLNGAMVIPGLVDIHIHGAMGADFSDGDQEGLQRMAAHLAKKGITSFAPASMTLPYESLQKAFETAVAFNEDRAPRCARLMGINMEGPFFSEKKKGAQNEKYLKKPDFEAFRGLYDACKGLIRIVDVAPELEGAKEFISKASELCTVSVAHTDADYNDACEAYALGATHLTHLFNAMPQLHHRKPGVIGAAAENANVTAELICDGHHIHPSIVRMAFKLFPGRICIISDALSCLGMPDGEYELGGQKVFLKDGVARLEDDTIAGAASDLFDNLKNVIEFGIPVEEAIVAATLNPAKKIGADDRIGSIETGKFADFLILDSQMSIQEVYIGAERII